MAFTSDNRPHTLGDLLVITGTVANGDTSTDLSAFMSEILMASVSPIAAAAAPLELSINGTTVVHADPGVAAGGKLFAIGKR